MHEYAGWVKTSADAILSYVDVSGKRVVDFGCGRGDWLKSAAEKGAIEILGLDSYALDAAQPLSIPTKYVDLTKPIVLEHRFDIALCLEVGEHLEAEYAENLVDSLVHAAPIIVFSAAVPGQGGVHHVNEQPPIYWHRLFKKHQYKCFDFRSKIWEDERIQPWYRMGVLVYVHQDIVVDAIQSYYTSSPLHLVHPDIFQAFAPLGKDLILCYNNENKQWFPEYL